MLKMHISFFLILALLFSGCSLTRIFVIQGTLNTEKTDNMSVRIRNSLDGVDTTFSLESNKYRFEEHVIGGLLIVDWFVNDSLVQTLSARNLLKKNSLYVQLKNVKTNSSEEYNVSFDNQKNFTLHFDLDELGNSANLACSERSFLYEYKYATYGEIHYPDQMLISDVKMIDEFLRDSVYRPIAIMGGGTCDKELSRQRNKYAKNAYGAEFYRRDAKNECISKNPDHGCDTLSVVSVKFGKGERVVEKWTSVYNPMYSNVNEKYKVHKIVREKLGWKIVEYEEHPRE